MDPHKETKFRMRSRMLQIPIVGIKYTCQRCQAPAKELEPRKRGVTSSKPEQREAKAAVVAAVATPAAEPEAKL